MRYAHKGPEWILPIDPVPWCLTNLTLAIRAEILTNLTLAIRAEILTNPTLAIRTEILRI